MTLANELAEKALSKSNKTNTSQEVVLNIVDKVNGSRIKDSEWIQLSFLNISKGNINSKSGYDKNDQNLSYLSSASVKITDSSIGGNICINPPPQFSPYADIRPKVGGFTEEQYGTINCATTVNMQDGKEYVQNQGMGRYYSEAIDDNNRIIHLRMGRPEYNSMWGYFKQFYSPTAAYMAREGKFVENIIVQASGAVLAVGIAPLMILPFTIMMLGAAVNYIMKKPTSKFYNIKHTMHTYWLAVETIVNQIMINKGITYPAPPTVTDLEQDGIKIDIGTNTSVSGSYLNSILPREFMESGQLNVFYIINKAKIRQMRFEESLRNLINEGKVDERLDPAVLNNLILKGVISGNPFAAVTPEGEVIHIASNIGEFISHYATKGKELFSVKNSDGDKVESPESGKSSINPRAPKYDQNPDNALKNNVSEGMTLFLAGLGDASQFLSIRVDDTGTVQESFSNNAGESSIAGVINSKSKQFSEYTRFGKQVIESAPIAGELITSAISGVTNILGSALDKWGIGGLLSFAGNSFADMPKQWESSSCRLPSMSYTVSLTSPYGDPLSQLINIYLPLATLLAAALPLSTGKQSYSSPFLCELYDRGRCVTRLGMIESLSITRGTGNLGFNNRGNALAIDVSFSVMDLSTILSVPVSAGFKIPGLADKLFDSENTFTDYMLTLSGVGLTDIIYALPSLKRAWKGYKADWNSLLSPDRMINIVASDTVLNPLLGFPLKGMGK